jgi:adenylate cyclase
MWNAPTDCPGHADRAVQAAIAVQNELPAINSAWAEKLGGLVRLGIGINTGRAQIGNSGSQRRLKYGPRGHAVNLTSRVEAATKILGVPCLLTGATRSALSGGIQLRRICRARLTGMTEGVDLYELPAIGELASWQQLRQRYEEALALYEQERPTDCRAACQAILAEFGDSDGPTKWLLKQADLRLADADATFDPVFAVETK